MRFVIRRFLFASSSIIASPGTHCSGGFTPRSVIVPCASIWAVMDVGNAVARIIAVIDAPSS
jgi:hypothetical protein